MKKLFLASLAIAALASCQKESLVDSTLTSGQQEMTFAPYAGASLTKGAPVNSNANFKGSEDAGYGSFKVSAHNGTASYYGFDEITYDGTSAWKGTTTRYWPVDVATLYFGAYYPATNASLSNAAYSYATDAHSLAFDYKVGAIADQKDLMYAITEKTATVSDYNVGLHFKHALTQVGFTATKATDINVAVKSITICNVVDNGAFTATKVTDDSPAENSTTAAASVIKDNFGTWTPATAVAQTQAGGVTTNLMNYAATMVFDDGKSFTEVAADKTTTLTSAADVLMLLPQTLTAWNPAGTYTGSTTTTGIAYGTDSYLAIDCVITGAGDEVIIDGTIYVPFSTEGIKYGLTDNAGDGTWLPGYKITYNLAFGGGYAIPGGGTDPKPGEVPDDVVPTLRTITYTVTVDEWIPVAGGDVAL